MNRRSLIYAGAALGVALLLGWYHRDPGGAEVVDVKRPDLAGAALAGEAAFAGNCARCHGALAGGTDQGPPLVHVVYQPGHHGDGAFALAARQGARQHHWAFGDMPPVEGVTDQQLTDITAFVRALQSANGVF